MHKRLYFISKIQFGTKDIIEKKLYIYIYILKQKQKIYDYRTENYKKKFGYPQKE